MSYTPPAGDSLILDLGTASYSPPLGTALELNFAPNTSALSCSFTGLDASGIGLPDASLLHRQVHVGGWDNCAFGDASANLMLRFVQPPTLDVAAFGAASFSNRLQTLGVTGFDATVLETPRVEYRVRELSPQGVDASAFGSPTLRDNHIRFLTASWPAFGTLTVAHATGLQTVRGAGLDAAEFGTLSAKKALLDFAPAGFVASSFGNARFDKYPQDILAAGVTAAAFGTARVWNYTQTFAFKGTDSFAAELDPQNFYARMHVAHALTIKNIAVQGGDMLVSPSYSVGERNRSIHVPRIESTAFGKAGVHTLSRVHPATCEEGASFGDTWVLATEQNAVRPRGDSFAAFGSSALIARVFAQGNTASVFGTASVAHMRTFEGFNASYFGKPALSYADNTDFVCGGWPRAVSVPGNDSTGFGTGVVT